MKDGFRIKPRDWQVEALTRFGAHGSRLCFLMDATPGAGKTYFSAYCSKLTTNECPGLFTVIVVPTTALKDSFVNSYHEAVGIEITRQLKDGKGRPRDYSGAVVTYAQLPNLVTTFETWRRNGQQLMFVFDEVHHASEDNKWGAAVESCGRLAKKILTMTGTPFRSDGTRISFLKYNEDGVVMPDASYAYRDAVRDNVCREVLFMHDDGVAQYYMTEDDLALGRLTEQQISTATNGAEGAVAKAIFHKDSEWLKAVMAKAEEKLDQYRSATPNAGGIIICRPGKDETDDRHVRPIARLIKELTGEEPTVITHDDPDADAKIAAFRKSRSKWIVSVRKVSEGVDIKRLRVMLMLSRPGTELLFRQLVGRVVRVENKTMAENATVFMAKFPQLVEWAARITEEAQAGLKDREEDERERGKMEKKAGFMFVKGCSHEDGGGTSIYGEQYDPSEINFAEELRANDPTLASVSVAQIAHLCKKVGVVPPERRADTRPLHEKKYEKGTEINRLARIIAYKLAGPGEKPAFSEVWRNLNSRLGVSSFDDLKDNHGIEKMDAAIVILTQMLASIGRAA